MAKPQELRQERHLGPTKHRHIRAVLAAAQEGAEADHQDFVQIMPRVGLARVLQLGKAGRKPEVPRSDIRLKVGSGRRLRRSTGWSGYDGAILSG